MLHSVLEQKLHEFLKTADKIEVPVIKGFFIVNDYIFGTDAGQEASGSARTLYWYQYYVYNEEFG